MKGKNLNERNRWRTARRRKRVREFRILRLWLFNWLFILDDDGEEVKDLIDDTPIQESEGEESDASGGQKRKKSDDENYDSQLEDEDYDLIEENLGVKVERRVHIVIKQVVVFGN